LRLPVCRLTWLHTLMQAWTALPVFVFLIQPDQLLILAATQRQELALQLADVLDAILY